MKLLRRHPWLLTLLILAGLIALWHFLTVAPAPAAAAVDDEYARLAGAAAQAQPAAALPTPAQVWVRSVDLLTHAFDERGTNDVGIGWHLWYSIKRVLSGYGLALAVALPLGFLLGMSPLMQRALNPFIQVLKPVSPMAWMPLALYTLKDSGASAIFIIFICALWPMLINTAFGVAGVRRDWLNVAKVLDLPLGQRILHIIFPAAVPMILTGMRISIGIAWFVIVAAEMVAGQSGIGYFIWNEWNNLQIASMITAIILIGMVGLLLDAILAQLGQRLSFRE
ncbi:nitrate ABC transporter permease [Massilia sp. W12]|uniref:nitrate ABC transporter permease n=1 Tax=Massilia sp. W12 TaxID=3126507 RepID=UPI0030CA6D13